MKQNDRQLTNHKINEQLLKQNSRNGIMYFLKLHELGVLRKICDSNSSFVPRCKEVLLYLLSKCIFVYILNSQPCITHSLLSSYCSSSSSCPYNVSFVFAFFCFLPAIIQSHLLGDQLIYFIYSSSLILFFIKMFVLIPYPEQLACTKLSLEIPLYVQL